MTSNVFFYWFSILLLAGWGLAGCKAKETLLPPATPLASLAVTSIPINTEIAPTATPYPTLPSVPLAAIVNQWPVTQGEYEAELTLYRASLPPDSIEDAATSQQKVLDELISQALLAQAAWQLGYQVDDAMLQARLDQISAQLGGSQALNAWIDAHGYTDEAFRWTLRRSMAAAWMRDQIANAVPTTAEQIHARQILLYNFDQANAVLLQLKNGASFADLAFQYDPTSGGDLGWFPRGYLTTPEVEEAAFALKADQFSDVISSPLGFHIVQVIAIEAQRPVQPAAYLVLQEHALSRWITEQRAQANIELRLP